MWDCAIFKEFTDGFWSNDEIFFYLHLRNIIFDGPELQHAAATFEVISHVDLEKLTKILRMQFCDASDDELVKLIEHLRTRAVERGKSVQVDGYFALRVLIQYYRNEKRTKLKYLEQSFPQFATTVNGLASLTYQEFKIFLRSAFKPIDELKLLALYRIAWSFGKGHVTFESFVAAADSTNLFLQEIRLENNTVSTMIVHRLDLEQKTSDIVFQETFQKEFSKPFPDILKWLYFDHSVNTGSHSSNGIDMLKRITSGKFIFRPRDYTEYQGDITNMMIECWIVILRMIVTQRNVLLDSSKAKNNLNKERSTKIKQLMFDSFRTFMSTISPKLLQIQRPRWVEHAIRKFQLKARSVIKRRAMEMFTHMEKEIK